MADKRRTGRGKERTIYRQRAPSRTDFWYHLYVGTEESYDTSTSTVSSFDKARLCLETGRISEVVLPDSESERNVVHSVVESLTFQESESRTTQHTHLDASCINEDDGMKTVDDALMVAVTNLKHLGLTDQKLKHLQTSYEMEKLQFSQNICRTFSEIAHACEARKRKLLEDVMTCHEYRLAKIKDRRKKIEKKTVNLNTAYNVALHIKDMNSSGAQWDYQKVENLIQDLQSPVSEECSLLDPLMTSPQTRNLKIRSDNVTAAVENIGKVEITMYERFNDISGSGEVRLKSPLQRKEYVNQNWRTCERKTQNIEYASEREKINRCRHLNGSSAKQSGKMLNIKQKVTSAAAGHSTEHHSFTKKTAALKEKVCPAVEQAVPRSPEDAPVFSNLPGNPDVVIEDIFEDDRSSASDIVSKKGPKLLGKKQKYFPKKMEQCSSFQERTGFGSWALWERRQKLILKGLLPSEAIKPQMTSPVTLVLDKGVQGLKKKMSRSLFKVLKRRRGFPELVDVSYVINPCHFYVRKYSERKKAHLLTVKLNHFCSGAAACKPNDVLALGESIMAQSAKNGMWCRGSVSELFPFDHLNMGRPNGPTQYALHDIAVMQILMMDYGHFEVFIAARAGDHTDTVPVVRPDHVSMPHVIVDGLYRSIIKLSNAVPVEVRNIPPLAVKCSLKDIVPVNLSKDWDEEARNEFLRMVNKKSVMMKIFKQDGDKLLVDLMKPPVDKISSDMPVSLRDALVFLDLARFSSLSNDSLHQFDNKSILKYCPAVLPLAHTDVNASVCHINNPSDFYIQPVDLEFWVLEQKLQEAYKEDVDNLEIICPVLGQACIAQFEDDRWYRARVIGLPGCREVLVMYVDYGNTSAVSVKRIRKIKDRFLCAPEQAVHCRLAYIGPGDSNNGWCTESIKMLRELTRDQTVKCTVIGVSEERTLSVELHLSALIPGKMASLVNTALVEEGLACFESGSEKKSTSTEENIDIWDASLHELLETATSHNTSLLSDSPLNDDLTNDLLASGFTTEMNEGKYIEVKITFVKSPSCIFVQPLSSESLIESLQEKMTAELATTELELVDWKSGMQCAVLENETKKWRRGRVIRVMSEDSAEVLFFDFGYSEVKSICSLRKLSEHFTHGKYTLECSLSEIRPTGGSAKWTATACDFLSHYLTGARVDIVPQEASPEWPLPVKMFCKNEAGRKINMSEYLIQRGLALREKKISGLKHDSQECKEANEESCKESDGSKENADDKMMVDHRDTAEGAVTEEIQVIGPVGDTCKLADRGIQMSAIDKLQVYKPPVIPDSSFVRAFVSCVGGDGTVYVIPKCLEVDLTTLMDNIQKKFKLQGLLKRYCWKNGDGCAVRGSDMLWYRGKVIEIIGGSVKVFYIDHGYIEKIPPCHLYPIVLYEDVPQFCIPCELYGVVPLGGFWQNDAVELLQELLPKRDVDVKIMEYHGNPLTHLSVEIYSDGMPLSLFMEYNKHCSKNENDLSLESDWCSKETCGDSWAIDFEGLHSPIADIAPLIHFGLPSLPFPGEFFSVTVKHIETPNEVFISLVSQEGSMHSFDTDDSGISCVPEDMTLEIAMKQLNEYANFLPMLTDFAPGLPCLTEYVDGLWYRTRILAIRCTDPVKVLIEYVDYGSTRLQTADRLRQIPSELLQYPVAAFRVKLAGFKPPRNDGLPDRIPYSPLWSMEALWTMLDCAEGKQLSASLLSGFPEPIVFLYEEEGTLIHMPLIEKNLADVDL